MRLISQTLLVILLLWESLLGQAQGPIAPTPTFHIKGTITDPNEAVIAGVKVTFRGEQLDDKVVTTNDAGAYEAELPLGAYTMTALRNGFRFYRRPLFQVASRVAVTIDVSLTVGPNIDIVIVDRPATPQELKAAANAPTAYLPYYGGESFSLPSGNGVPYKLLIGYTRGEYTNDTHNYTGEKTNYDDPVFVAYNLFSLHADRVTYNVKRHSLEANGNVVVADGSGATQRADAMSFKIEDGRATPPR